MRVGREPADVAAFPAFPRPKRPQLTAVLATLCDSTVELVEQWEFEEQCRQIDSLLEYEFDPGEEALYAAEQWERMNARGIVPDRWLSHPSRRFGALCTRCSGYQFEWVLQTESPDSDALGRVTCSACDGTGHEEGAPSSVYPTTMRAVIALACSIEAATTAEALHREALERVRPWGATNSEGTLLWRVLPSDYARVGIPLPWEPLRHALRGAMSEFDRNAARALEVLDFETAYPIGALREKLSPMSNAWGFLASQELLLSEHASDESYFDEWLTYADVPDPMAPLLDLWKLGFAFDAFEQHPGLVTVFW